VIDFARAKIVFALAMAGILFAIHPLVENHGRAGFEFFEVTLTFQALYYTFLTLLGCTIYFYALDFLAENPMGFAHRVGNLFYAISLLFPPVFAVVALSATVAEGVVWISDSPLAGEVSKFIITLMAGCAGLLVARILWRRMNSREREASSDQLAIQSRAHLRRAEELMEAQHYDLVALESFRAIETSLQHGLLSCNAAVPSTRANLLIPAAARAGLIPEAQVGVFHELRVARNRAVHGADVVDERDASWFLATTRNAMKHIALPSRQVTNDEAPPAAVAGAL
jgi:hypothetical protein